MGVETERRIVCEVRCEEPKVAGHPRNGQRPTVEVEPLIDDRELEIEAVGDLDQLAQAGIERRRVLPADDEAVDPGVLGPLDVLLEHLGVVARVVAEERVVDLRPVPGLGVVPDVVVSENRNRPCRGGRGRGKPAREEQDAGDEREQAA